MIRLHSYSLCIASTVLIGCSIEGDNSSNPLITANQEVVEIFDLRITKVELQTPTPAMAGQGVAWTVFVDNIGTKTIPNFSSILEINGRQRRRNDGYGALRPGGDMWFGPGWKCGHFDFMPEEPGIYEYRFEVRPWSVEDIDLSNNSVTGILEVIEPPPDFQPPEVERPRNCQPVAAGHEDCTGCRKN